jgi:hypothetical protein
MIRESDLRRYAIGIVSRLPDDCAQALRVLDYARAKVLEIHEEDDRRPTLTVVPIRSEEVMS